VLVDEHGKPIAGELRLIHYGRDGLPIRDGGSFLVNADENGRFKVEVSFPHFRLEQRGDGIAFDPLVVDVEHASTSALRVVRRAGSPVALRPRLEASGELRVTVVRGDGERLFQRTLSGAIPSQECLAPGDYLLLIERADGTTAEKAFSVGEGPFDVPLE
jgi:hypothetical protein